jgi:hypothetical protein
MSLTALELFSAFPCTFDDYVIPDVVGITPSPAVQKIVATPAGSLNPTLVAEVFREPTATLTALDIGRILQWLSLNAGYNINTLARLQYQQRLNGGAFMGNGNHVSITSPAGFLMPESIRAQQDDQQPAQLQMKFWGLKNGSNPPMAVNTGQNLTSSPDIGAIFKLGPVVIDGSVLAWVQSSQVHFGIEYKPVRGSGATAAEVGFIRSRKPTAELGGDNLSIVGNIGMGLGVVNSALTIYFLNANGAPSDAVHTSITFGVGSTYEVSEVPAQGENDAQPRLMVTGIGPLSYNTTAVHP